MEWYYGDMEMRPSSPSVTIWAPDLPFILEKNMISCVQGNFNHIFRQNINGNVMWASNGYHHPIRIGKSICVHFFNICNTQPISCFMLKWNIGTVHFFQRITWSKNCSSLWFLFLRLHSSLLGINSVRKVYQHVTSGLAWGFMFHVALLRPSLCKAR